MVQDVKNQLWSTLHEYPLRQCAALSAYIDEAVRVCWLVVNHTKATLRLDYSSTRYEAKLHERAADAFGQHRCDKHSEHILYFVWPALVDSADNSCLVKAVVVT